MTAPHDLDRLLDAFLADGADELPEPSFDAVRDRTESTRQRVVIGPWRIPDMNKFLALGAGIAAVVLVLAMGSRLLPTPAGPASSPVPIAASATIAPSPAPSATPRTSRSASPAASPAPLTQTFTSRMNGFSVSYPEGWIVRAATEPWTESPGVAQFSDPGVDVLQDPMVGDHLFLYIASRPIGDLTPEVWVATRVGAGTPFAVDGATGLIGNADSCCEVAVTTAGRGYWIGLYTNYGERPAAPASYDRAWFEEVLATVQLHPEDAVEVAPSATP
jgi:hypothetical protein